MILLTVFVCVLVLTKSSSFVEGYCIQSPLQSEITGVSKRVRNFCEYKSPDGKSSVRLFPGSKLYTADCLECSCSLAGLSCCGFGSHAGTIGLPDDCMNLQDGCREFHVKKTNNSLDCFTGQPFDFAKMAFKPHPDNFVGLDKTEKGISGSLTETQTSSSRFVPSTDVIKRLQIPWRDLLRGVDLNQLNIPTTSVDLSKLPITRVDLSKLSLPTSGLDLSKLNLPISSLDLTKMNVPLSADLSNLKVPLSSADLAKLSRAVPGLDLTKLSRPLPVSEILQELMAKHPPAANTVRTVKVETRSETGKEPQTKVEAFNKPLPQNFQNRHHTPMILHNNQDVNNPASWWPWLFVDHI